MYRLSYEETTTTPQRNNNKRTLRESNKECFRFVNIERMTREQIINKIMDEINKHLSDNAYGTVTLDLSTNDIRDILKKHLPQTTGVDALVEILKRYIKDEIY